MPEYRHVLLQTVVSVRVNPPQGFVHHSLWKVSCSRDALPSGGFSSRPACPAA